MAGQVQRGVEAGRAGIELEFDARVYSIILIATSAVKERTKETMALRSSSLIKKLLCQSNERFFCICYKSLLKSLGFSSSLKLYRCQSNEFSVPHVGLTKPLAECQLCDNY